MTSAVVSVLRARTAGCGSPGGPEDGQANRGHRRCQLGYITLPELGRLLGVSADQINPPTERDTCASRSGSRGVVPTTSERSSRSRNTSGYGLKNKEIMDEQVFCAVLAG